MTMAAVGGVVPLLGNPTSRSALFSGRPAAFVATPAVARVQPGVSVAIAKRGAPAARAMTAGSSQSEGSWEGSVAVRGVLFDMDGVLCDSEERSRDAAVDLFSELGVSVKAEDFIPFMGTGEANFLGGVAKVYGVESFDPILAKKRFFEIYTQNYAKPNSGLGYPGALELVLECRKAGLKLAVASSADRIKVDANLAAAGLPQSNFDAIVSADAFERLKPAPDIFLAAAKALGLDPSECVVVEDALAGIQAAQAAGMRSIAVTTTLSEGLLQAAGPSLVRTNIGDVTLSDILNVQVPTTAAGGGSNEHGLVDWVHASLDREVELPAGFSTTRRDLMRFGSLALGSYALFIVLTRWKAMTYASPLAVLDSFLGTGSLPLAGTGTGNRVDAFKRYITDLEAKRGGPQVPEFPPGLRWLNSGPLRFKGALRGKVVILDFWTYCCINCMHVLPDLAFLEKKYKGKALTVVGVHSAKFDNEKDLDAIRNAVLRYDVTHPVVNDGDMILWRQLGVSSWPTFLVVSPNGRVLAKFAGEGHRMDLDDLVAAALDYYGDKKLLNIAPIPEILEKNKNPKLLASPLSFPGKIASDLSNQRLFISDSNHNRIVVTDLGGNMILQVGSGIEGLQDGSFSQAAFNRPQGVAYDAAKNLLYVADTENHSLRLIDFVNETVSTLAGNGERGSDYKGGKKGASQVLNSPWDISLHPKLRVLYIAMAGQHQIWTYDLTTGITKAFSGDGYERNLNGSSGRSSSYAQPSGLSFSPEIDQLYVADSESSSIRAMNLQSGGSRWLSGGDPSFPENLFQFGDKDGPASQALFQHPLGVISSQNGVVYIADSYNHKIKRLNLGDGMVRTIAGTGVAGYQDGIGAKSQFSEPAGLAPGPDGTLLVADTNNDVIRVLKFGDGGAATVGTLALKGVSPPQPTSTAPRRLRRRASSDMQIVRLQPVSAARGEIELQVSLPPGYHFTKEATSKYDIDVDPDDASLQIDPPTGVLNDGRATLKFDTGGFTGAATLRLITKVYYCQEEEVCLYKGIVFQVPLEPSADSQESVKAAFTIS